MIILKLSKRKKENLTNKNIFLLYINHSINIEQFFFKLPPLQVLIICYDTKKQFVEIE